MNRQFVRHNSSPWQEYLKLKEHATVSRKDVTDLMGNEIAVLLPGDSFGERSLREGVSIRQESAVAVTAVELLTLPKRAYIEIFEVSSRQCAVTAQSLCGSNQAYLPPNDCASQGISDSIEFRPRLLHERLTKMGNQGLKEARSQIVRSLVKRLPGFADMEESALARVVTVTRYETYEEGKSGEREAHCSMQQHWVLTCYVVN